jgi:hypothetical protein
MTHSFVRGVANFLSGELVHPLGSLVTTLGHDTWNDQRHFDNVLIELRVRGVVSDARRLFARKRLWWEYVYIYLCFVDLPCS